MTRTASAQLALLPLFALIAAITASCVDDVPISRATETDDVRTPRDTGTVPDAGAPDVPDAHTPDTDLDARDVSFDTDTDDDDVARDAAVDTHGDLAPVPDASPPVERPATWACDRALRVSSCDRLPDPPLAAPNDPADLLFYVNRDRAIPSDFPIPSDSTWTPCDGGTVTPAVPMTCLPAAYRSAAGRGLRSSAWDSEAPTASATTHDGLPVGFRGRVGFKALIDAARAEAGHELLVASAFRSYATQAQLHERYVGQEMATGLDEDEARIVAATYSARPGHSEHQLGTTADLTYRLDDGSIFPGLDQVMGASRAFIWATSHAHRFGIVLTYDHRRVAETRYVYEPWHFRFVGVEAADAMRACDLATEEYLAARYDVPIPPEWEGMSWILWNDAQLVGHPSLPPGAGIEPGTVAIKAWRVVNAGTRSWSDVTLTRIAGADTGDDAVPVMCTAVGRTVELEIAITAPATEGRLQASWQLVDDRGDTFGPTLPLDLNVGAEPGAGPATWVRVRDLSDVVTGADPGADIDAIGVVRASGGTDWATEVAAWVATPSSVSHDDARDCLGPPDAFYSWPATSVCAVDGGFVSLGGAGELVVRVPGAPAAGDAVVVLEVGGCSFDGGVAIEDRIEVSAGPTADGPWQRVAEGVGPDVRGSLP